MTMKIAPFFILGTYAIARMPKPAEIPEPLMKLVIPSLLVAANELLPRSARISGAFNYFACINRIARHMSDDDRACLRDLGRQVFTSLDITTNEFDALEDLTAVELKGSPEALEKAIAEARLFRRIVKNMMQQDGEGSRPMTVPEQKGKRMKAKFIINVEFDNKDYTNDDNEPLQGDDLKAALAESMGDGDISFDEEHVESVEVTE